MDSTRLAGSPPSESHCFSGRSESASGCWHVWGIATWPQSEAFLQLFSFVFFCGILYCYGVFEFVMLATRYVWIFLLFRILLDNNAWTTYLHSSQASSVPRLSAFDSLTGCCLGLSWLDLCKSSAGIAADEPHLAAQCRREGPVELEVFM